VWEVGFVLEVRGVDRGEGEAGVTCELGHEGGWFGEEIIEVSEEDNVVSRRVERGKVGLVVGKDVPMHGGILRGEVGRYEVTRGGRQ
jgi:hypothetical protein